MELCSGRVPEERGRERWRQLRRSEKKPGWYYVPGKFLMSDVPTIIPRVLDDDADATFLHNSLLPLLIERKIGRPLSRGFEVKASLLQEFYNASESDDDRDVFGRGLAFLTVKVSSTVCASETRHSGARDSRRPPTVDSTDLLC